ncbi:uncharacterized protein G2W53_020430 [Senna tora]|uniref:Uncharacterized protein n=1 Tax=Senna tora TaxID=362788 RepID=A0A834WRG0_9FABA|nr:uncharacterized protein G2W53_020430 [Senna tora]
MGQYWKRKRSQLITRPTGKFHEKIAATYIIQHKQSLRNREGAKKQLTPLNRIKLQENNLQMSETDEKCHSSGSPRIHDMMNAALKII